MRRVLKKIPVSQLPSLKNHLFSWSRSAKEVLWLDSNSYPERTYGRYEAVLAVNAHTHLTISYHQAFKHLEEYYEEVKDWIFGYLSYDLKNAVESLQSKNTDALHFPDLYFFQPKKLFLLTKDTLSLQYTPDVAHEMDTDLKAIQTAATTYKLQPAKKKKIKLRIHKEAYKNKIKQLLSHIHRGDIYEANFCQEFYAHGHIDPWTTFTHLNTISSPPFATFLRMEEHYCCSASPERYLCRRGDTVITQPIKGTAARGATAEEDNAFAKALTTDPKERAENIMIVDLTRNDLSRIAKKASVHVPELCRVYPFKQVHQMISTVTAEISSQIRTTELLRATFPMGSMTGAPKVRAMQLIEELESSKRGLYSGAIGYIDPNGDFDFNVVIRSILYNAHKNYISYTVGSAITAKSDPDKEYEECLLKAKAMRQVLEGKIDY